MAIYDNGVAVHYRVFVTTFQKENANNSKVARIVDPLVVYPRIIISGTCERGNPDYRNSRWAHIHTSNVVNVPA